MYHYIEDRVFLGSMRATCADTINRLVQKINNDGVMEVRAVLIGSGAKNLVTQNGGSPVDLDYNLCICKLYGNPMKENEIKEYVKCKFDEVLREKKLGNCKDSRSALTTEAWAVMKDDPTKVKIDLGIVRETAKGWQRLIHQKTGCVATDEWFWNDAPNSRNLEEKVQKLKKQPQLWQKVSALYLDKKNMYLRRNDRDHPSYIVYIETVNEIYDQHFGQPTEPRFVKMSPFASNCVPLNLSNYRSW